MTPEEKRDFCKILGYSLDLPFDDLEIELDGLDRSSYIAMHLSGITAISQSKIKEECRKIKKYLDIL